MNKKAIVISVSLIISFAQYVSAQTIFPESEKTDKTHVMSSGYWKYWNSKEQRKIDQNINLYRKADAVIRLNDVKRGSNVKVEQITSDFIFGASIFNFNQLGSHESNEKYKSLWGTLFNRATVPFYWKTFEMQPGRLRFSKEYWDDEEFWNNQTDPKHQPHWRRPSTDQIVDFLREKNIAMHGHTFAWGNRKWNFPEWLMDMTTPEEKKELKRLILDNSSYDEDIVSDEYKNMTVEQLEAKFPVYAKILNEQQEKRITEIAKYYGNKIKSWDIVNESAGDYGDGKMIPGSQLCKSGYGLMPGDYAYKAFKTAEKVLSDSVKFYINDWRSGNNYPDQIKSLLKRGCRIDVVGSQMHLFKPQQCLDIAAGKDIQTPYQIDDLMSRLSETGLPIHLSEITITSPGSDTHGQEIQAVIAYNLYRKWFSIKNMMGITWWNVVDNCGAPGEPSVSGLFNRDMTPKLVFYALDNLINHQWKTDITIKADKDGGVSFRGFKGMYKITYIDNDGNKHVIDYHLK